MAKDLLARSEIPSPAPRPGAGMEEYHYTHHGNGDRFHARYAGQVLLHQSGAAHTFYSTREDGRWVRGEGAGAGDVNRRAREIVEAMRARARALEDQGRALGDEGEGLVKTGRALAKWAAASDNPLYAVTMAKSACTDYGYVCDPDDEFDVSPHLLATPSGVLDLGAGEMALRAISPADKITYSTGVEWDPGILDRSREPALVTEYLATFMPDHARSRLVWKALGSTLLGGNSHRLLVILKGQSTTGKTQLVEALRRALGDYAGIGTPSVFRGNLEDKARPDVISLLKKRVAFLAEASKNWELHGDRVKGITGGDGLKLRRMHSNDFLETVPHFTPVIYTNEMPRINGADSGLKRRILVIDFNRTPQREDPAVKQAFLASEAVRTWLLARLVQGYLDSRSEGLEDVRAAFADLSQEGFDETSHLGEFFEWLQGSDQLAHDPEGVESRSVLARVMHERYQYWIKAHGNKQDKGDVLNYREFNSQLKDNMGWKAVKSAGYRWTGWYLRDAASLGLQI